MELESFQKVFSEIDTLKCYNVEGKINRATHKDEKTVQIILPEIGTPNMSKLTLKC